MRNSLLNKKWINLGAMVIIVGLTLKLLIGHINPMEIENIVSNADAKYFGLGILCLFGYWALEAFMIHHLLKQAGECLPVMASVKSVMVGQFYSYLTPFASGGQPMQVVYLGEEGVPAAKSTAVLVTKFLLFQITVTSIVLYFAILKGNLTFSISAWTSGLVVTGLTINIVCLTVIVLMALRPVFVHGFLNRLIHLLAHFRFLRKKEEKMKDLERQIESYADTLTAIMENRLQCMINFGLSIVQIFLYFSVAWCIYKGFGLEGVGVWDIIAMQAFLYMAVAFIPTPGTVGAAEAGFAIIMGPVFTATYASVGILMWRGITFYFGLVFSGFFVIATHYTKLFVYD